MLFVLCLLFPALHGFFLGAELMMQTPGSPLLVVFGDNGLQTDALSFPAQCIQQFVKLRL